MNAKHILLMFLCVVSLSGICKTTDPPSGAEEIRLRGALIASARDIGNYAAGYVAGVHGISWESARLAFDALETMQKVGFWQTVRHYPNNRIIEGQPTQQAQYKGYTQGQYTYISRKRK